MDKKVAYDVGYKLAMVKAAQGTTPVPQPDPRAPRTAPIRGRSALWMPRTGGGWRNVGVGDFSRDRGRISFEDISGRGAEAGLPSSEFGGTSWTMTPTPRMEEYKGVPGMLGLRQVPGTSAARAAITKAMPTTTPMAAGAGPGATPTGSAAAQQEAAQATAGPQPISVLTPEEIAKVRARGAGPQPITLEDETGKADSRYIVDPATQRKMEEQVYRFAGFRTPAEEQAWLNVQNMIMGRARRAAAERAMIMAMFGGVQ